jgi:proteasome lid subunit RPN8/RPN11
MDALKPSSVTVPHDAFEIMAAHARAAYADECCGLLIAPAEAARGKELVRAIPCRNLQNQYHARFPEEYPRDARTAYLLDPRELARADDEARARGERVAGIFHSHIDVGAYFSEEDVRVALMGGDEPAFADFVHIVLDARRDEDGSGPRVHGARAFAWDATAHAFRELPLEVVG